MVKFLYAEEIAERLNVSLGTLHKKEFQERLGLPIRHMGKRIYILESEFEEWALNSSEKVLANA